ncbi:MAG: transposase family protein [Candidatus Thiodiazotropha sp. (ex Lucinoma aequizonata)]|nr:transposase family protein [Candidatus Thiodiazotropha sp. (ex Lucinoma aequizonata)]MCU7894895.1 transposase family protein [Candidatus Thiodiazotropha sp. (ex Lucinoma aequizonata)]MCU7898157.1 transposase family protein [Candidatus Thiodiazotropha sp. (ex Lucinoma aequizonata)]MCU7901016.1 transposase family protein [Candidatus Thiodiazotropha sp. (ex Lucinoma aequizonata)]MCU7908729.1 transposase family protein [Candidatus Thiodiazotropha sp. (ex Lucinoma aequizonata)]
MDRFGYPLDPGRYHGTIYCASNWILVGSTKGYQRTREGYSERTESAKLLFMMPLQRNACTLLSRPRLSDRYQTESARMKLTAKQMLSLYDYFKAIDDPRRAQEKKHQMPRTLSLAATAILCGMRGYKDISI